jgi:uncharacterized protein YgiM (DUF1202 family)
MRSKTGVLILVVVLLLAGVMGASAEFGTNWTALYYNNVDMSGSPAQSQTGLAGINFNWGSGSPVSGVNADRFSARFTSTQNFAGGSYEFTVSADDGVRVYVDGQLALDRFISRPLTTDRFTLTLTPGSHSLTVEYFEDGDQASISFQWNLVGAGGGAIVITATPAFDPIIITATPSVPPTPALPPIPEGALTATVVNARVLLTRAVPNLSGTVLARIRRGETYAVVGRDADARWFVLQLADRQVWALGYYLFINGNEFNPPVVSSYLLIGNPAQYSGIVGQSRQGLRLREAPTTESAQIGRIGWGDVMAVVGRTGDGRWYQVIYKDTLGWVTSDYMRIIEGNSDAIPVTG